MFGKKGIGVQESAKTKKRNIFVKILFWLALALSVFLALFVLGAKLFMQNLSYWEKDILHYIQSKVSFSIDYKQLKGEMSQIDAVLKLDNLTLGDKKNPFFHIDKLNIKTDFLKSLFNFSLVLDRLEVENMTLWLEETDKGWYFRGLKKPKTQAKIKQEAPKIDGLVEALEYLELIFVQGSLKVENLNLYIKPKNSKQIMLFSSNLEYVDVFGGKQLYSQVLSATQEKIGSLLITKYNRFIGTYEGYQVFLDIPKFNVAELAKSLPILQNFKDYNLDDFNLFGDLVGDRLSFEIRGKNLRANPSKDFDIATKQIALSGVLDEEKVNLKYSIDNTKITDSNKLQIKIPALKGVVNDELFTTKINFAPINLDIFKNKWEHKLFTAIPELKTLQPTGIISALEIDLDHSGETEMLIKVKLDNSDIQAWSGAPSLKNLNAWVIATPSFGRVVFKQDQLEMGFPDLFNSAFALDRAQGVVDWEVYADKFNGIPKDSVIVSGRNLLLEKQTAKIYGSFNLLLPGDDLDKAYFDLNLGLQDVPYYFVNEFLPEKIMDKDLVDWIKTSTKAGEVSNATLWIADSYADKAKQKVDLSFDVKNATLKFLPDWQDIENVSGILNINDGIVSANLNSGTILGAQLEKGTVQTYNTKAGELWLQVTAKAQSKASIMQTLFKETPIKDAIPKAIQDWRAGGTVRADLDLRFPLGSKKAEPHIGFFARMINSKINLVRPDLVFENVNGTFEFDNKKGFFSKGLTASLWGMPISAIGKARNIFAIEAKVTPYKVFNWLNFDTKKIVNGASSVKGILNLDTTILNLTSDLKGVELNLPKPFYKPSIQKEDFVFDLNLKKSLLRIDYADKLRMGIQLDAQPKFGIVNVADKNVDQIIMPPQGLFVSFLTNTLFVDDWLNWWDKLSYSSKDIFGDAKPLQKSESDFNWQLKLDVKNIVFKNKDYKDLSAIARNKPTFEVAFINPFVTGNFILNQNSFIDRLGSLTLKKLHLPENLEFAAFNEKQTEKQVENQADKQVDKQAENKPSKPVLKKNKDWLLAKFKALDLRIDDIRVGKNQYGALGANLEPDLAGLEINNINWNLGETNAQGYLDWRHIPYDKTKAEIKIDGGNLSKAIKAVTNTRSPIETGEHSGLLRLAWAGKPYEVDLKNLRGNLDFKLEKGEFPKIDLGALKGITRIFSLFNIDTLIRRLSLDFSDVTSSGLAFNSVAGSAVISEGVISTVLPIEIKSTATSFSLEGEVDLGKNFINQELVVVLPVSQTLPLVALLAGASQVGMAIWAAQKLFGNFLDDFTKARYKVYGDLNNPNITLMKVF